MSTDQTVLACLNFACSGYMFTYARRSVSWWRVGFVLLTMLEFAIGVWVGTYVPSLPG